MTGGAASPFTMVTAADLLGVDGAQPGAAAGHAVGLCVDGVCEVPGAPVETDEAAVTGSVGAASDRRSDSSS